MNDNSLQSAYVHKSDDLEASPELELTQDMLQRSSDLRNELDEKGVSKYLPPVGKFSSKYLKARRKKYIGENVPKQSMHVATTVQLVLELIWIRQKTIREASDTKQMKIFKHYKKNIKIAKTVDSELIY